MQRLHGINAIVQTNAYAGYGQLGQKGTGGEGAEAWGILSTIVEPCKRSGVKVKAYLNWILEQIAARTFLKGC